MHISYPQSYSVLAYPQGEWPPQEYNSYWKNKAQQQDFISQNSESWNNQLVLLVAKQSLMIIAGIAAITESQSNYSNFEWDANFHHSQE